MQNLALLPIEQMSLDQLRSEVSSLRLRERELAELLDADSTELIVHDLRNVLNELQLLRLLADTQQKNA